MIKWTDFALCDDFGPLLDVSDVVSANDIIHDLKSGVAPQRVALGCIRKDAENGMRIQETESVTSPARMVGTSDSDDLKIFPTGRMLESEVLHLRANNQTGRGA